MKYKVEFLQSAINDLEEIVLYIATEVKLKLYFSFITVPNHTIVQTA